MKCNFDPPNEVKLLQECIVWKHKKGGTDCGKESDEAAKVMKSKYEYLGSGMFRHTYRLNPKCVVKIANDYKGSRHQLTEFHTWNMIRNTKKKKWIEKFAPVISTEKHGTWLVMADVPNPRSPRPDDWEKRVKSANDDLHERGIFCDDLHSGNWGLHGNKLIAIDYGFGCSFKPREKTLKVRWSKKGGEVQTLTVDEFVTKYGIKEQKKEDEKAEKEAKKAREEKEADTRLWAKFKEFVKSRGGKFVKN